MDQFKEKTPEFRLNFNLEEIFAKYGVRDEKGNRLKSVDALENIEDKMGKIVNMFEKADLEEVNYGDFKVNYYRVESEADKIAGYKDHSIVVFSFSSGLVLKLSKRRNVFASVYFDGMTQDFDVLLESAFFDEKLFVANSEKTAREIMNEIFSVLNQIDQKVPNSDQRNERIGLTILELVEKLPREEIEKVHAQIGKLLEGKI